MNIINKSKVLAAALFAATLILAAACGDTTAGGATADSETQTEPEVTTESVTEALTEQSEESGEITPAEYENITYKKVGDRELALDIYGPTVDAGGPAPVLFYIHGGSWISGTRSVRDAGQISVILSEIRELGVAVVPVTYRLTSETVTYPAHINDVTDAIRYIVKHAGEYNLDPNRMGLVGFSAGGHLSLLAGFCTTAFGDDPELAGIDFDIKCVIDFCGPTDFTQLTDQEEEEKRIFALTLLAGFLGKPLPGNEDLYASASPINHVGENPDLSLLIFQGRNDELVPYVQVDRLYEKCVEAGLDVKYVPVENATHSFAPADPAKPTKPSMQEIISECITFIKDKLI
jgi:acetyl esterase/lipase